MPIGPVRIRADVVTAASNTLGLCKLSLLALSLRALSFANIKLVGFAQEMEKL
jgi:hypothetical protein